MNRRNVVHLLLAVFASGGGSVMAHGVNAGQLRIEHPYATPSPEGETSGAVYFKAVRNEGTRADRLLSATSSIASAVEIHRLQQGAGVMQARAVAVLALPAGVDLKMRHNTPRGYYLKLLNLKAPLKDGDRFALTLTFEHAGSHEVKVWVQTPRAATSPPGHPHP